MVSSDSGTEGYSTTVDIHIRIPNPTFDRLLYFGHIRDGVIQDEIRGQGSLPPLSVNTGGIGSHVGDKLGDRIVKKFMALWGTITPFYPSHQKHLCIEEWKPSRKISDPSLTGNRSSTSTQYHLLYMGLG